MQAHNKNEFIFTGKVLQVWHHLSAGLKLPQVPQKKDGVSCTFDAWKHFFWLTPKNFLKVKLRWLHVLQLSISKFNVGSDYCNINCQKTKWSHSMNSKPCANLLRTYLHLLICKSVICKLYKKSGTPQKTNLQNLHSKITSIWWCS